MTTRAKEIRELGNTGYLEVDANGNVGIGKSSPDQKLDVNGTTATSTLLIGTTDNTVLGGTQVYIKTNGSNNLQRWGEGDLNDPDSYRFRIDQGFNFFAHSGTGGGDTFKLTSADGHMHVKGNVHIGDNSMSTAPNEKLEITQSDANDAFIKLSSTYADGYDAGILLNNTHTGGREYKIISTNNSRGIIGGGKLAIVDNTAGNNTDRFVINSVGNIGIGTYNPDAKLHVYSNGSVELRLTAEGSNDPSIFLTGETTGGYTNEGFKIRYDNSVGNTYFDNILDSADNSKMIFRTRAGGTPTENVVMQADGGTHFGGSIRLYNSASDPSNPEIGDTYFNTSSNQVKTWTGSVWDLLSNKFSASGGTENTYTGYKSHTFTSSGTFTADTTGVIEYMIIAGGGGGGSLGGGGGAGGCLIGSTTVNQGSYTITVGGGGGNGGPGVSGSNGGNSSAFGITAIGGGGGGSHQGGGTSSPGTSGGSGGGGSDNNNNYGPGSGTSGQGNAGGNGIPTFSDGSPSKRGGGGGGGKTQTGRNYTDNVGGYYGNGGAGIQNNYINGTNYYFAGGGGRSSYGVGDGANNPGDGGVGGGGGGSPANDSGGSGRGGIGYNNGANGAGSAQAGGSGGANTGGGAGGNGWSASGGAAGGSGIVVIRYTT